MPRPANPDLGAHYARLVANGGKKIVAMIAIARKLITVINARVRDTCIQPDPELCR
tara:strand:+ start:658 stop:825 length:168 start_codon:yes stop_codon:yes gene_type:complete